MQAPPPPPPGGYPPQPPPPPPAPYGGYTPQPYAPGGNYAGFWIRVVAYVIDIVILGVVGSVIDIAFHANPSDPQATGTGIAGLINFAIGIAYFVGFWSAWSATLGQRVLNLRVVDSSTMQPITAGKAVLRYIGLIVAFLVCFIGVIWVAFDARKQGWADKIASTVVVRA